MRKHKIISVLVSLIAAIASACNLALAHNASITLINLPNPKKYSHFKVSIVYEEGDTRVALSSPYKYAKEVGFTVRDQRPLVDVTNKLESPIKHIKIVLYRSDSSINTTSFIIKPYKRKQMVDRNTRGSIHRKLSDKIIFIDFEDKTFTST